MMARVANLMGRYAANRRRACKLRQIDLATHLGVSRQWVIAFEHGRRGLDLDLALKAYEELGLGLDMQTLKDAAPEWVDKMHDARKAERQSRPAAGPRLRRSPEYLDALRARAERDEALRRQAADVQKDSAPVVRTQTDVRRPDAPTRRKAKAHRAI